MTSIRKTWWAATALSAPLALFLTGCGGESTEPPAAGPASTPAVSAPIEPQKPVPEPTKATEPPKEAAKPEPAPAKDAPKVEAPKVEPPKVEAPKVEPPKADAAKKADAAVKLTDDELAEIKKLPAAEISLATAQGVCPASGEHLGSMGTPIKVTAEGKSFYICCKGCKKEVEDNPKGILAKLAK